jgi:hypothetical protein
VALVSYNLQVLDDNKCIIDVEVEVVADEFVGELVEGFFLLLQVFAETALLLFGHGWSMEVDLRGNIKLIG